MSRPRRLAKDRSLRTAPLVTFGLGGLLFACGVAQPPASTGGVLIDGDVPAGCPRALAALSTDYASTNISILSRAGTILSESFISSASASVGLTTALSGDVVLPSAVPSSNRLVLIDRYPNSVITWVDLATAHVIGQLSVGTGFASNPHDYLEISPSKAYVSRYESNPQPGREPFDGGGDVLILDAQTLKIVGRITLGTADDGPYLPRPDRMLLMGKEAWVSLERLDAGFTRAGDARVVGIDSGTDTVAWTLDLPGVAACGAIAPNPSRSMVALACSGLLGTDGAAPSQSAVVVLDARAHPPVELKRFAVAAELGAPVAPALAFASDHLILGVAYGDLTLGRHDAAYGVDVDASKTQVFAEAGAAFAFGDLFCAPACSDACFLADAERTGLRVFMVDGLSVQPQGTLNVDPVVGLPPRSLGAL